MSYPETRTVDAVDALAGVEVPDPYRWLEESTSEEVQLWQKQQNEFASAYARSFEGFDKLRGLVEATSTARFGELPREAVGKWFRSRVNAGDSHAHVVVTDDVAGKTGVRVVFNPAVLSSEPPFLSWFSPSPDGTLLAVGVCADGSEQNDLLLVDVATGTRLPVMQARLMDNWSGGVAWLPDSSGFYVTVIDGAAIELAQRVVHYDIETRVATTLEVPFTSDRDYRMVQTSHDGTTLVAYEGLTSPAPVAVADLEDPARPDWQPFVTGGSGVFVGEFFDDEYIAVTDVDAPRGRVVSIRRDRPDPSSWRTLVPENGAVLRSVKRVGDFFYVSEFVDTYARIRIFNHRGDLQGVVPLPGLGALGELPFPFMNLAPSGEADSYVFAFSTLTSSWGVYRHTPGAAELEVVTPPAVTLKNAVVEDHWATSKDGWRVPYHVVRPADVNTDVPQPTLVYAYGGFNAPWVPQFPGAMAAFVDAGGTFVHAHLRGGGEFGRDGWEQGRQSRKQNGYDDLYAVAEDLIARGRATNSTLAVTGGSNGGLMSGVAVTQRPDLWRAAVPRVPVFDLIGACRENYGRYAVQLELGDIEDPNDVRRMLTVSPYHCVTRREYPSVFIDAGDTDPRCTPWHSRKFGARLQAGQTGENPILIRIWENVGHGWATDKDIALEQSTEWLAFVCRELDVSPK